MKVKAVNPGKVVDYGVDHWGYNYTVHGMEGWQKVYSADRFPSASAAKQAMREKVAQERKRHGLGD